MFDKMSSSKSLSSSGTESETKRMTDFTKFELQPYSLEPTESKVPVGYDRNSVSDLANSSHAATNDVNGRIGNKTYCKCECCAPMETCIESICCLEIPEIYKPRFSGMLCLYVCRSDPHFIPWYSMGEKSINYSISTHIWSLPNQNKSFILIQTSSNFFKHFTLLITSSLCKRCCFGSIFFQKSKNSILGVCYYWKVISYCQNLQKQPSTSTQKAFK